MLPRLLSHFVALGLGLGLAVVPAVAKPYPKDDLHDLGGSGFLMPRGCAVYCGYDNQYCCGAEQVCYTSSGIAGCANTVDNDGGYNYYTTTWTETETFTSTYSSYYAGATTTTAADCVPSAGSGDIACGNICCASWQYCAYRGQCMANAGALGSATTTAYNTYTTTYTSNGATVTSAYSAPYRVTSGTGTATGVVVSATASINGTVTTSGSHLSGGAIAGIVIGSVAGVFLLAGICACVLIRGLWNSVLALLGLGGAAAAGRRRRDSREEVTVIEEERYRRGSRAEHTGWFGRRPTAAASSRLADSGVSEKPKKKSSRWLGMGAALGTLLLLLGLRRHDKNKNRRPMPSRSDVSSGYYYSDGSYTASSAQSSRESRRSRGTRGSYRTDYTRTSRASRPSRQARNASRNVSRNPSRRR